MLIDPTGQMGNFCHEILLGLVWVGDPRYYIGWGSQSPYDEGDGKFEKILPIVNYRSITARIQYGLHQITLRACCY